MKKTYFSIISDSLFVFFTAFIVFFAIFASGTKPLVAIILSLILAGILSAITFYFLKKNFIKNTDILKEEEHKKKIADQLVLLPKDSLIKEIKKARLLLHPEKTEKTTNTPQNGVENQWDFNQETTFFKFSFDDVSSSEIADIYKTAPPDKNVTVYGIKFSDDALILAKKLKNVLLIDIDKLYEIFKKANYYPKINIELKDEKPKLIKIFTGLFLRRHSKSFFLSGTGLLLLSFLTPFRVYYIVFGGIFITLSLYCRFYGKEENKKINK